MHIEQRHDRTRWVVNGDSRNQHIPVNREELDRLGPWYLLPYHAPCIRARIAVDGIHRITPTEEDRWHQADHGCLRFRR